jgi:oligopeptide transport system substrate-binding protein
MVQGNGYNVAEARRLLAEAGYPNGQGLPTFELLYNTSDANRIICEYAQQAWRTNLGVNTTLRNMEWASFLDYRTNNPAFQIARAGWLAAYMDPNAFLELLVTGAGSNDSKYSNPEFDRLMRQAATMSAGPERLAVLRQAEELAITQEQALIPVYYYVAQNMINLDVWDGWYVNPLDEHSFVGIRRK